MKILEITTFLRGGAGMFVTEISKALKNGGHKVHVVSAGKSGDLTDWQALIEELEKSQISHSNMDFFSRNPDMFWTEVQKLVTLVNDYNFDIIHVHSGNPALAAHIAKKTLTRNIPVIATFHSWGKDRPTWMNKADTWAFNQCEEVYFDSYEYEGYAISQGITNSKGVIELGLLFDAESYWNRKQEFRKKLCCEYGFSKDDIIISQLGEITERKGQLDLIKSIGGIGNKKLKLLFIGECKDKSYENKLIDTINEYGIKNQVHFTGWISRPHELIAGSDAFVFPTYSEGFGLVIIEAIALKIPTIFSVVEGTKDISKILIDNNFGTFIPGDLNAIQQNLKNFLNMDDGKRKYLIDNMANLISDKYNFKKTITKYKDIIEKYKNIH